MENTEAQRAINLATDLSASRQECDMLYRELSKVRDELITSKTERRVLSRWYEDAKAERDKLQADMAALVEDLKASSNLIRAADKDLDDLKSAKDEMQNKLAETTKDLAYSRLAVDTMSERDKRFTETIAKCGAATGEDIGDFIERTCAERDKLHSELVKVRSALADVSAERDSLRTTLATWEAADTAPFVKVPDVADHVMPPVLPLCMRCHECGRGLVSCSQGTKHHDCPSNNCPRTCTVRPGGFSPYSGPCKSDHPVRHE